MSLHTEILLLAAGAAAAAATGAATRSSGARTITTRTTLDKRYTGKKLLQVPTVAGRANSL
ncbi:MAG: hypothetical protein RJR35_14945 [Thermoanaerobacterales bacterium]|nr:hypothetical protein [Thermoanaerobacterales bacterium]HAF17708.1 hypothetical protein [Peptococcaceae bacterium]